MDECYDRRRRVRSHEPVGVEGLTPRGVHPDHLGSETVCHFTHAFTEDTVHPDHDDITGSDHIDERGLHAGRAGAADGEGERVLGPEDPAQAVARLVELGEEVWVQVAEQGRRRAPSSRPGTDSTARGP